MLHYPTARQDSSVDNYFGTTVPAPYRWMENLDSPELEAWVRAENEVTFSYLATLPEREAFRKRITELWNYPRISAPSFEGGQWYYSYNSGLQRQAVIHARPALDQPARVILDPNTLSPDGSVALSDFAPAPAGQHFVYGLSQAGSDWSVLYVRELATGRQLPDAIDWVKFRDLGNPLHPDLSAPVQPLYTGHTAARQAPWCTRRSSAR